MGIGDNPPGAGCAGICMPPWLIGIVMPFMPPVVAFACAGAFAAILFLMTGFFAEPLVAGFFAGFFLAAGLVGIGIFMPGMFICATAGADTEASASALAANNNMSFTE